MCLGNHHRRGERRQAILGEPCSEPLLARSRHRHQWPIAVTQQTAPSWGTTRRANVCAPARGPGRRRGVECAAAACVADGQSSPPSSSPTVCAPFGVRRADGVAIRRPSESRLDEHHRSGAGGPLTGARRDGRCADGGCQRHVVRPMGGRKASDQAVAGARRLTEPAGPVRRVSDVRRRFAGVEITIGTADALRTGGIVARKHMQPGTGVVDHDDARSRVGRKEQQVDGADQKQRAKDTQRPHPEGDCPGPPTVVFGAWHDTTTTSHRGSSQSARSATAMGALRRSSASCIGRRSNLDTMSALVRRLRPSVQKAPALD